VDRSQEGFLPDAGDNDFSDDFSVLYPEVDLPICVEIDEIHRARASMRESIATL
jgi:hypothetical protein